MPDDFEYFENNFIVLRKYLAQEKFSQNFEGFRIG